MRESKGFKFEEGSRSTSVQLETGVRTIDSSKIPDNLAVEEREALGREILDMSLVSLRVKYPSIKLEIGGEWWTDKASSGGILYNGKDIWKVQKGSDMPGAVAFIQHLQDGGAHLSDLMPEVHMGMRSRDRHVGKE